jgi:hypothetical protein
VEAVSAVLAMIYTRKFDACYELKQTESFEEKQTWHRPYKSPPNYRQNAALSSGPISVEARPSPAQRNASWLDGIADCLAAKMPPPTKNCRKGLGRHDPAQRQPSDILTDPPSRKRVRLMQCSAVLKQLFCRS